MEKTTVESGTFLVQSTTDMDGWLPTGWRFHGSDDGEEWKLLEQQVIDTRKGEERLRIANPPRYVRGMAPKS